MSTENQFEKLNETEIPAEPKAVKETEQEESSNIESLEEEKSENIEEVENVNDEKKSWVDKLFQSNPSKLKEKLDDLTAKNEEMKDKYLRLYADFDNFKKRNAKERLTLLETAGKEVIIAILPIVDDFERALKSFDSTNANDNSLKEGMELVYHKLLKTLEAKGVKTMETEGKNFDPELHEAITEIPAINEESKGKIVDTTEKGYFIYDKILRHAKVVVGK